MKKLQESIQESQNVNEAKLIPFNELNPGDKFYCWWYGKQLFTYTLAYRKDGYIYATCDDYEDPEPHIISGLGLGTGRVNTFEEACAGTVEDMHRNSMKRDVYFSCPAELKRIAKVFMKKATEEFNKFKVEYKKAMAASNQKV